MKKKKVIGWIQVFVAISLPIRCRTLHGVLTLGEFHSLIMIWKRV